MLLPRYHGDGGWYGYAPVGDPPSGALGNLVNVLLDIYLWSLRPEDRTRLPAAEAAHMRHHPDLRWIDFLEGKDPDYPVAALRDAMDDVRQAARRLRASGSLGANPVSTTALINLTLGGERPRGIHARAPFRSTRRSVISTPGGSGPGYRKTWPRWWSASRPTASRSRSSTSGLSTRARSRCRRGAYGEHHATRVTPGETG